MLNGTYTPTEFINSSFPSFNCEIKQVSVGKDKYISYKEWNPTNEEETIKNKIIICVHGLSRNSSDFDYIAAYLSTVCKYKVFSIDVIGRGNSSWLDDASEYNYSTYIGHALQWIPHLCEGVKNHPRFDDVPEIYWIGTSMGGIIGMLISSLSKFKISRLVLNDIGPFVSAQSLVRLAKYCGHEPDFTDLQHAKQYFSEIYKPFGDLSDAQWEHIASTSIRPGDNGNFHVSYDRRISVGLTEAAEKNQDILLWEAVWDKIPSAIQVLLVKGEQSDILSNETVEEMKKRGPGLVNVYSFPNVGHAPSLMNMEQVTPIVNFLQ